MTQIGQHHALIRALEALGSQAALAALCGVTQPAVWKWVRLQKSLPAEHVLKVEAATGISRHDLRSDLYPRETGNNDPSFADPASA
ncbi:MAG: YdaS family helix-turn-helix protein [Sphingomonas phyllosphaerae]